MPDVNVSVTVAEGGIDLVEPILQEWAALAGAAENDEPFYHAEFIAAHLCAFAPKAKVLLLVARRGRELRAILPLIREIITVYGIPVRQLRAPVNHHSLRFDVLKYPGKEGEEALRAIWEQLKKLKFDVLELADVPEGGFAGHLLRYAEDSAFKVGRWHSMKTPFIPLGDGPESYLRYARHSLVVNVKKCKRKILREQRCLPTLLRKLLPTPQDIDEFYKIENAGWKGAKGTAIESQPEIRQFYDEVARAAQERRYFCFDELRCGNHLVAASYSFILNRRYFALKWAYDERYHRYSPGHLLIDAILDRCVQEGITEFDFMGPMMDYKAQWTTLGRDHSFLYIFGRTWVGRLIHALKFDLIPRLRAFAAHTRSDRFAARKR